MSKTFIEEKTFEKADFTENALPKGDYENCRFINCDFSNSDLSNVNFADCEFSGCNLSLAKIPKTAFKNVKFRNCKLLGLRFDSCNDFLFAVYFENCILNISSFYKLKLKGTNFINSSLQEVDFTLSDLSNSLFDNCDMARATFENTVLNKTDFRTSYNYSIDPELNRMKKAKFSLAGVPGLLAKYDIEVD